MSTVRSRCLRRRCAAFVMLLGLLSSAVVIAATDGDQGDALQICREQRHTAPTRALPACEQAAQAQAAVARHDDAFEAWMHAAELASQSGEAERSKRALDQATTLLSHVADSLAAHRLARRRGLNAYREGDPAQALARFLEALSIARSGADRSAAAISENDLGVTYRHLGNYTLALGHFEASLDLREALGHNDLGALMANIGSLYLELGDLDRADSYLVRALADHRAGGRELPAHRTLEDLATLAWRRGDRDAARADFDRAWLHYVEAGTAPDQLRLALARADLEASAGSDAAVRRWLDQARALAQAGSPRDLPLRVALIEAAIAGDASEQADAYAALLAASAEANGAAPDLQVRAQRQLADLAERLGRLDAAITHLRALHEKDAALAEARHGERFDALRVRFDVARLEVDHERLAAASAQQDAELARRRMQTVLVAAAALLALAVLAIYSQSRLYRQRVRSQAERQVLEARIAEVRRAAEALRSDVRSMTRLLDQHDGAALLFDAGGHIRAVTATAAAILDRDPLALRAAPLTEVLPADVAQWAQTLVESASLAGLSEQEILGECSLNGALDGYHVQCRRLALEEEMGVLRLVRLDADASTGDPADADPDTTTDSDADASRLPGSSDTDADDRQRLRQSLVELMRASLDVWERQTRRTRIDLAQASGVWRITVDDGRLRVRAMDRYLGLETLPERPRWREVLRTAYYVLAEVSVTAEQRSQLESLVEAVLRRTRASS